MGAGSSDLISAGAQFAAVGIFGRSTRKAQKATEKEQQKLLRLQQEEQSLRNKVLAKSLNEADRDLPFNSAQPSRSAPIFGSLALPEGLLTPGEKAEGMGWATILLIVLGGGALLFLLAPGPP